MKEKKNEREEKIKKGLGCKFVRINSDAEGFDIFLEISKIQNYMDQSK